MPPWTRVADGLWQALCPSFYRLHPLKLWSDPKLTKRTTPRYFHTQRTLNTPGTGHQRTKNSGKKGNRLNKSEDFFFNGHSVELNASGEAIVLARGVRKPHGVTEGSNRRPSWGTFTPNTKLPGRGALSSDRSTDKNETSDGGKWHANREASVEGSQQATIQTPNLDLEVRGFKARHGRGYQELNQEELHGELRRTSTAGDYPRSQEILRILIQGRGEKPSRRHFQALLLANASAQHGSAAGIIGTVQEMEEAGITMDSAAYHAVLRVLAIHPHYLLRRQIMEELRHRWFTLSIEGWHDVIVGLLRDKQIESAIAMLQSAQQVEIRIAPWLYDMLVYNLCGVGELDEVLSILRFRVDNGEQRISGTVWCYFLDAASSALHHAATLYAWRKRVETGYLNPSSGICLNVLNTAARHGDFFLATDVIRLLGKRNQALQLYHYEALVESYLPSDLRTALLLLTLMTSTGMPPTDSSTRAIILNLRQFPHFPRMALSILRGLYEQGRPIPVEAFNVVIESYIDHGKSDMALEAYKTLRTLCASGPSTSTFNRLFRGCRGRKDVAMFLVSEMVALKVSPDALTYDSLILVCMSSSQGDPTEDAWRYFEEMRAAGWWPRRETAMAMARRCCHIGDERIWRLQGDGIGDDGIQRSVLQKLVDEKWMRGKEGMRNSSLLDLMDSEDPWT